MSAPASRNRWIDTEGVDVIVDVPNSAVALAVQEIARTKNKVFLATGTASSRLTADVCSPTTVHWTYDTYALAHGTGQAVVETGGDTWFFIAADFAVGAALQGDTTAVINAKGGKVLGGVRHPINSPDFASYLLQAQASKAKIIGLATAGGDMINLVKQSSEFGIVKGGQRLAALLAFIADIHTLGLAEGAGNDADGGVLLGPRRQDPRLVEEVRRTLSQGADDDSCRDLRRSDATI